MRKVLLQQGRLNAAAAMITVSEGRFSYLLQELRRAFTQTVNQSVRISLNITLSYICFKLFTYSISARSLLASPPALPPPVSSYPHSDDHKATERQPFEVALGMPHCRRDPVSKTDQADDRHLGTSERRAFVGGDQRLSQLGCAKVVGPAKEERQRDGDDEDDGYQGIRCCGRLVWVRGARGGIVEAFIEKEEAEDGGNLRAAQSALII